jgi:hypothetical protein
MRNEEIRYVSLNDRDGGKGGDRRWVWRYNYKRRRKGNEIEKH